MLLEALYSWRVVVGDLLRTYIAVETALAQ